MVGKIAAASDEQAGGVTYINRAIQEISDAAMTNAVRAEELTVVANELAQSNQFVSRQIQKFDLGSAVSRSVTKKSSAPIEINPEKLRSKKKETRSFESSYQSGSSSSNGLDMDERGLGQY